jgi:8-oxo-dGTP diphosphatase
MAESVRNIASGNARVGVQAGDIYGNISIGQPAVLDSAAQPAELRDENLAAQLAELRARLSRARTAGEVDEATFAAAEEELVVVTESLPASTEQGRNKAMIALKRLRGLLMDVDDLASKVASVIAAVRGD